MPPRDQEEYESRRQQIIDGALHVFGSKGFEKATNKDIARAAKIKSPGLIYHYFEDKADLFRQVLEQRAPALQLLAHSDEMMSLPPRQVLAEFGMALLKTLDNQASASMFKLMLSEAVRRPAVAEMFNKIAPERGLGFLTTYLARQMDEGALRRLEPGVAARCFAGPLIAYVLTREVFVQPDSASISAEKMVESTVDVFLKGMEVRAES